MNIKSLIIALLVSFGLFADCEMLQRARTEHMMPYRASKQLDSRMLGNSALAQKGRCTQIKVIPQCTGITGIEGVLQESSCGYHAVKNGLLCALALLNSTEGRESLNLLQSYDYGHFLFGMPYAPWRQEVMSDRFKGLAKKIYRRQILKGLKKDDSSDVHLIRRCINDLQAIDPVFTDNGFRYTADKPLVCAQLRQRMEVLINAGSRQAEQLYSLVGRIDQFFTDSNVDFTISLDGHCYAPRNPSKSLGTVTGDQYGKWVTSAEITTLVESQKSSGLLQTYPELLVATYGEDLGGNDNHAVASESLAKLYALATESDDDVIGVVLVYLSNTSTNRQSLYERAKHWLGLGSFSQHAQDIQKPQDNGHWVAFVVSRINKEMRYYVLDSINSSSVVSHQRIQELVDFFDGKKELPGYQWTVSQLKQPTVSPDRKPLLSDRVKFLLGCMSLSGFAWYGYTYFALLR